MLLGAGPQIRAGGAVLGAVRRPLLGALGLWEPRRMPPGNLGPVRTVASEVLPKLPVPPLRQTLHLFLKNLRPIVTPAALREAEKLVTDLTIPGGQGDELQAFLETRAKGTENWLSDWWLEKAYLDLRCPLPVNLSPALSFPLRSFSCDREMVEYAAKLCRGLVAYKAVIDEGRLKPDMAGKAPMDMGQYKLLFGTNRRPGLQRDVMRYGKDSPIPLSHIAVARRGHFFRVEVYSECGEPLSETQIQGQLNAVLQNSVHPCEAPLGIVSSDERTQWAATYERVRQASAQNAASLEDIESALFLLALDKAPKDLKDSRLNEQHRQLLHGSGSQSNAANRWFDKTLQFCVGEDGISGITYEHSPAEGPPVAALMDYVMDYVTEAPDAPAAHSPFSAPKALKLDLGPADLDHIRSAGQRLDAVVADLQVEMLQFKDFGKNLPKAHRLSPDSFCQMAFQLTFHKLHGTHPPTYETGTLRQFHLGRTETIRLPSTASAAFVEAMRDPASTPAQRSRLLAAAVADHKNYTLAAMSGNAMDRHLLGLRLAAQELGVPEPALFQDPSYAKLAHFQLSTSQVPTRHEALMAFGPSADDCYGICYNPQEAQLNVSVSAFRSGKTPTDAREFARHLVNSLREIKDTLELGQQAKL